MATTVQCADPALPGAKTLRSSGCETFVGQAMKDDQSPLTGHARTILNDPDLTRGVVQDTFVRW